MDTSFTEIVQGIAKEYITGILFVDEKAFEPLNPSISTNIQKNLDADAITRAFSQEGKTCGFYAPKSQEDIEICKQLVVKPDIVVLDWDIDLKRETPLSKEEETQDDEADYMGHNSLELLKAIVSDAKDEKLKVVFIYTGEIGLNSIVSDITNTLGDTFKKDEDGYEVSSDNVHIIVRLKPDSKVSHTGFEKYVVPYRDLPKVVIAVFAKYVCGLMPCFAMKSMTAVRKSSAKILKVYNAGLDPELLGHQMALHNPTDVRVYLANSLGSAISDLIISDKEIDTDNWAYQWIENQFQTERTISVVGQNIRATSSSVKLFFDSRFISDNARERVNSSFLVNCSSKKERELIFGLSAVFHKDKERVAEAKYGFAALSHYKNLLSSSTIEHILTLGTIVNRLEDDKYYLCIQQRCDTSRVPIGGMRFVFLPLYKEKPVNLFGAISLGPNNVLYIKRSSSNAVFFTFAPKEDKRPVVAEFDNKKFIFKSSDGLFEWQCELKDIIAQRIVSAFAGFFARVGVDEAEWLRVDGMSERE